MAGVQFVVRNPRSLDENIVRNLNSAEAIGSRSVGVYSGPPCIEIEADDQDVIVELYKIGLAVNFGMGVNVPIQTIFEIGSNARYQIRDRAMFGINLQKVLIDRDSLAKVLYSYYFTYDPQTEMLSDQLDPNKFPGGRLPAIPPNSGGDYFNLASDLFDHPFGLFVEFRNYMPDESGELGQVFSQWYVENVYIAALQRGVTAGAALIAEGAAYRVDRIIPIPVPPIEIEPAECVMGSEWRG